MSTYLNAVIRRTRPATRAQCAVMGIMTEAWSSQDEIWKRRPVYAENKRGRTRNVCYGTIGAVLRGLVQQGYVDVRGGKRKQYREAKR